MKRLEKAFNNVWELDKYVFDNWLVIHEGLSASQKVFDDLRIVFPRAEVRGNTMLLFSAGGFIEVHLSAAPVGDS